MFDAIAPRYDLLNHVLSAGHRSSAGAIVRSKRSRFRQVRGARSVHRHRRSGDRGDHLVAPVSVVGMDFFARDAQARLKKMRDRNAGRSIRLVRGDADADPARNASCDAATIGFGIRNVSSPDRALAELARYCRRAAGSPSWNSASPGYRAFGRLYGGNSATAAARRPHSCRNTGAPTRTCLLRSVTFLRRPSSRERSPPQDFQGPRRPSDLRHRLSIRR